MKAPDVILTEIIRNQLVCATEEMAKTLIRTAYSPLLYEVQDIVAEQLAGFAKFPPRQKPASFNLDQVLAELSKSKAS